MSSKVEICNLALGAIGQGSINSMAEASVQAQECTRLFSHTLEVLLRQFPWNFATKSVLLGETSVETQGWTYTYVYPSSALFIRKVFAADSMSTEIPNPFEIVSSGNERYVCCDIYQAYAKYTMKITDVTVLDPLFVDAFAYRLAMSISVAISNNPSLTKQAASLFQQAIGSAQLAGAIEGAEPKAPSQQPRSARDYIMRRR